MALLCGGAGRLTAERGGVRQWSKGETHLMFSGQTVLAIHQRLTKFMLSDFWALRVQVGRGTQCFVISGWPTPLWFGVPHF